MTSKRFDLVISGAGIAGLVAGVRARQKGLSVLIVENQNEFRSGPKGDSIQPPGLKILGRMGLLEKLYPGRALINRLTGIRDDFPKITLPYPESADFPPHSLVIRHKDLKLELMEEYLKLDGTLWFGASILDFDFKKTSPARSLRIARTLGSCEDVSARSAFIAQGPNPALSRKCPELQWRGSSSPASYMIVGETANDSVPPSTLLVSHTVQGGILCGFELDPQKSRIYAHHTAESANGKFIGKWKPRDLLLESMRTSLSSDLLSEASIEGQVFACPHIPLFCMKPSQSGFTLIGDVAGSTDPIGGFGLSLAIADGFAASEGMAEVLGGPSSIETFNREFNAKRLERYLKAKFISQTIPFLFGKGRGIQKLFQKTFLKALESNPTHPELCMRIFSGTQDEALEAGQILELLNGHGGGIDSGMQRLLLGWDLPRFFYSVNSKLTYR